MTESTAQPVSQTGLFHRIPNWAWVAAAIIGLALYLGWGHITGSSVSRVNPDALAQTIGAASCFDSSYELTNRLDGSKAELYSCNMQNGSYKCVTDENGVARDVTAEAKLVFAGALGTQKPDCVVLG